MAYRGPRKTLNLTPEDEKALAPYLEEGSAERDELARMVGEDSVPYSESAALVSLAKLGAKVVRDRILERGYVEWAAGWQVEDEEFTRFSAAQAGELWADDAK